MLLFPAQMGGFFKRRYLPSRLIRRRLASRCKETYIQQKTTSVAFYHRNMGKTGQGYDICKAFNTITPKSTHS
ncbi:hypothetical protein SAMN05421740_108144 [Parapedobacter koreensis]|uniref:Uncharacterized protein n=1 Tax=Parapedobacter koreensis TaxID=332977 RepID=A0A1H7S812_9SPHI|nr:hypothetical protein SAMN05421740_108144 [Parapedobacter koreensis]